MKPRWVRYFSLEYFPPLKTEPGIERNFKKKTTRNAGTLLYSLNLHPNRIIINQNLHVT